MTFLNPWHFFSSAGHKLLESSACERWLFISSAEETPPLVMSLANRLEVDWQYDSFSHLKKGSFQEVGKCCFFGSWLGEGHFPSGFFFHVSERIWFLGTESLADLELKPEKKFLVWESCQILKSL